MDTYAPGTVPNSALSAAVPPSRGRASRYRRSLSLPRLPSRTPSARYARARDLDPLLASAKVLASARDLETLAKAISEVLTGLVGSTCCTIFFPEGEDDRLTIRAFYARRDLGWDPEIGRAFSPAALAWHARAVGRGEAVVVAREAAGRAAPAPDDASVLRPGLCSALLVPLLSDGRCLGVASLGEMRSWGRSPFAKEKVEYCRAVAAQGALAIENFRAFDAVARQSRETQLILDNVTEGVFRTDGAGRILVFNRAAEKLTGYRADEAIGRPCAGLFHGQDADGFALCGKLCPAQQVQQSGGSLQPIQVRESITRRDGTRIPVLHNVAPIFDPQGRIDGTVSVIRNVSREDELLRIKSEFVSMVSHQLRAPLANVSVAAGLLAESDLDEATQKEMLRTIDEQCTQLCQLVDRVLELSRWEKGRLELTLEPLALALLVGQAAASFRSQAGGRRIDVQAAPALPFVLGSRQSVEVVIENLLQNAAKYSPAGTTITLTVEEDPAGVVVGVMDEGPGIPANQLENIFRPFRRVADPAQAAVPGVGLGLHIAKMLVNAQGGEIWAESRPGRGACFRFRLQKLSERDGEDTGRR